MADRHRKGYYEDYARRTGKKDRHRKGYYHDYNMKHPERIARAVELGYIKENSSHPASILCGPARKDEDWFGRLLRVKDTVVWHDDDWEEESGYF